MKIIRSFFVLSGLLFIALTSACIESDEVRSFYIEPDGKVDVVIYQDNVHATDDEKGPQDLQEWFRKIKSHQGDEVKKLKETGAKDIEVTLIRKSAPYAAVISATYNSVQDFGRLFDLNREGQDGTITLEKNGTARRLVFQAKDDGKKVPQKKMSADDSGNYAPIWRFIPVGGKITRADGFIINADNKSCLLNLPKLDRMKKTSEGYLFSIDWNVE